MIRLCIAKAINMKNVECEQKRRGILEAEF